MYEPYNSNELSSFVELVIVIDNRIYKSMDSDIDRVHRYCKDIANIINAVSSRIRGIDAKDQF